MTLLPELSELSRRRREIQDQLATLGALRPGTLNPCFRKCASRPVTVPGKAIAVTARGGR